MHACIDQKGTTAECSENTALLLLHLKQEHKLLGGWGGKSLNNLTDKGQQILYASTLLTRRQQRLFYKAAVMPWATVTSF